VLAYACQELQMPFYTIDINPAFLDYTRSLLSELGLADHTTFFCGTMTEFVLKVKLKNPPLLVFVDSDHNYFGVLKDIQAIYRLRKRPYAIAFHDFSLRSYAYENIRVDQAILDAFGKGVRYQRIGFQFGEKAVPGKDSPTEDGSYWDDNGSEGVIIETKAYKRLHL
jgi:predicted O-methyltransferase YrrM